MNRSQATHAKSMARKIKTNAESMSLSMNVIEREDLEDVPLDTVKSLFGELEGHWHNIQSILADMLHGLDEK